MAWELDHAPPPPIIIFNGCPTLKRVYFILKSMPPASLGPLRDPVEVGHCRGRQWPRGGQQQPSPFTGMYPPECKSPYCAPSLCPFRSRGLRCRGDGRAWLRREVSSLWGEREEKPICQVCAMVGREVDGQGLGGVTSGHLTP